MTPSIFIYNETGGALYICSSPTNKSVCTQVNAALPSSSGPSSTSISDYPNPLYICESGPSGNDVTLLSTISKNSDGTVSVTDNQDMSSAGSIIHSSITFDLKYDFIITVSVFNYNQLELLTIYSQIPNNSYFPGTYQISNNSAQFTGYIFGNECLAIYEKSSLIISFSGTCFLLPPDVSSSESLAFEISTFPGSSFGSIESPGMSPTSKWAIVPEGGPLDTRYNFVISEDSLSATLTEICNQYTWTGLAGDGKWSSLENWILNNSIPSNYPGYIDLNNSNSPFLNDVVTIGQIGVSEKISIVVDQVISFLVMYINQPLSLQIQENTGFSVGGGSGGISPEQIFPPSIIQAASTFSLNSSAFMQFYTNLEINADVAFNIDPESKISSILPGAISNPMKNQPTISFIANKKNERGDCGPKVAPCPCTEYGNSCQTIELSSINDPFDIIVQSIYNVSSTGINNASSLSVQNSEFDIDGGTLPKTITISDSGLIYNYSRASLNLAGVTINGVLQTGVLPYLQSLPFPPV